MTPPARADEVRVRAATADDAAAVAGIYAPLVRHTAVSFELEPPSAAEIARRMTAVPRRLPWLVADRGGTVVGYAYATPHRGRAAYRWSVETSVYVATSARGSGIGARLYDVLLLVLTDLGYACAYAGIALPNPASEALHAAAGFRHVGTFPHVGHKLGRWHDTGWWWRPLQPADGDDRPPAEPAPWDGRLPGDT
jgi:L-amino acid N-acyltransferase YncA